MAADDSPTEDSQPEVDLDADLRGLIHDYRQKAGIFPDDSNARRTADYCADRLKETLEDHGVIQSG